jgi:hypothetical protein
VACTTRIGRLHPKLSSISGSEHCGNLCAGLYIVNIDQCLLGLPTQPTGYTDLDNNLLYSYWKFIVIRVCINCIKEPHLKKLVEEEGGIGVCTSCGSQTQSIDTSYNRFFQLIKALIRFHYSEWDYNTHWGGDSYHSLFYGEDNILFYQSKAQSDDSYEDMVLSIIESPVYEDYDKGVTVFAGYMEDGSPAGILRSIKSERSQELVEISKRLKDENYFIVEDQLKTILLKYKGRMDNKLQNGTEYYRARIGISEKKNAFSMGFEGKVHYSPYRYKEISAPSPRIAGEGRINRSGVSFFYAATDKYTAVSEVRPHPGDQVSIGKFRLNRDVMVCDFSDSQIMHFFENDKLLDEFVHLNTLNAFMNKTVTPSGREHYTIT